jgi:hypothetical protein
MSPTLLGLPRELRNEIYGHLSNSPTALADPLPLNAVPSGTRKYTYGMHSLESQPITAKRGDGSRQK